MAWPFGSRQLEERAISSLPFNVSPGLAGNSVEQALALVPVYAAVRDISEAIAGMPIDTYRKAGEERIPVANPAFIEGLNAETRMEFIQRALVSLLLRGNAYGLKSGFGVAGEPTAIRWLHPDRVTYDEVRDAFFYQGRELGEAEIFHIPAMVVPGKRLGVTPITACSSAVRTGLAIQDTMSDTYRNRAVPSLKMKNTRKTLKASEAVKVKDRLKALVRAGEPIVLGSDWDLDAFGPTADDAAFILGAKLNATQIAAIFGMPPERIGGETGSSMTYTTTELQQIQFLTRTLLPWINRLEAAFSALLPSPRYVRFNADATIRVDTKTRWEVYQIGRNIGARSVNEIKRLEDEPSIGPAGDDYSPPKSSSPMKEARSHE